MLICLLIFLIFLILYLITFKKKKLGIKKRINEIASFIFFILKKLFKEDKFYKSKIAYNLKILNSIKSKKKDIDNFYIKKIYNVLIIILLGNIFIFLVTSINFISNTELLNLNIKKNNVGKGDKYISFVANNHKWKHPQTINLKIKEKVYSKKKFNKIIKQNYKPFLKYILNNNKNINNVRNDLKLPNKFLKYPFDVIWYSENNNILTSSGKLKIDNLSKNGKNVRLVATITYHKYEKRLLFDLIVYIPNMSIQSADIYKIKKIIKEQNNDIKTKSITLPKKIKNRKISWHQQQENYNKLYFFIILIAFLICIIQNKNLNTNAENKKNQMLKDYPDLLNKFILLLEAGMNVQQIWNKIIKDNSTSNRYIYKEMQYTKNEIDEGIPIKTAYENFSLRCNQIQYTKFINMLVLNIKTGARGLPKLLINSVYNAYEDKKSYIKIEAQKINTKLLIPMAINLIIVLIIVIIPAFLNINF